jgi:metal-sulfur cluster biosynthetic enzyme
VPAHRQATYLVFYGNPQAERPDYPTDLVVRGEDYALDIENHHYLARLSRQVGQLERLTYKRQHGLELYAGGKGHGEPPGIDWAHDYVDEGHFQKLRMRNAPHWPNFEIVRGPLCTRVRRWGFPYSPLHPLFTPSRVHMDQTYVFYAGLPYFLKEGHIDVVKDVAIAAMRDDEWVFSGYSFTDMVWIDHQGKLHEGSVPPASAKNLWGVGFFNRTSHDAFIALWLAHDAQNFDGLSHGGPPTLHYDGHGQLWSRYPAEETMLKAGASIHQKNAYLVAPYERQKAAAQVEAWRHQLTNPLELQTADVPQPASAHVTGRLARDGELPEAAPLKNAIWKALREVHDEQLYKIDANVVDMGYVYDVRRRAGVVTVLVTMPHRGRSEYRFLESAGGGRIEPGIRERVLRLPGVRDVLVEFTWNPPWTADRLSDAARRALGLPV